MPQPSLIDIAIDQGVPLWAAEALIGPINNTDAKRFDNIKNTDSIKYLSYVFPELKSKLQYHYEGQHRIKTNRTMFRDRFRTLLRSNLQNNGIAARTLTESMIEFLLGYRIDELIPHIEKQFTAKMRWDNQGSVWHLDHIYPCAHLKYSTANDSNFKKLWSIDNLRPLCKIENIKKGSKIPGCGENG